MLIVNFGYDGTKLMPPHSVVFNNYIAYRNDILTHPFAKRVITEIDKNEIISDRVMYSPLLGTLSLYEISGSSKGVLLTKFLNEPRYRDYYFRGQSFGDNCLPYLLEVGSKENIKLAVHHLLMFPDIKFEILVENDGSIVTNLEDYYIAHVKFLKSGTILEGLLSLGVGLKSEFKSKL